ncbi:hypothetical protein DFH07DRAFT_1060970 [Mycena maculata]|uniref:Uncharacterized protein n=1 Tax=Mycena maculata TaxID=230809 RepID=A0AAD7J5T7_9AGAR|nr:hypothetical protein DFH07DRAFT_1060970 [Mycena maculata]
MKTRPQLFREVSHHLTCDKRDRSGGSVYIFYKSLNPQYATRAKRRDTRHEVVSHTALAAWIFDLTLHRLETFGPTSLFLVQDSTEAKEWRFWRTWLSSKFIGGGADVGDNPEPRTLFFRQCSLAEWPIIPLFVFDGRKRPKVKAPGEAEAELPCLNLNSDRLIDAIITDGYDGELKFGFAVLILELPTASLDLSRNKANPALDANGKASKHHVMMYTGDAVQAKVGVQSGSSVALRPACGWRLPFRRPQRGQSHRQRPRAVRFNASLAGWRAEVNPELRSNSRGFLQRNTTLTLPLDFLDLDVLANYATGNNDVDAQAAPLRNEGVGGRMIRDNCELDIRALAEFYGNKFTKWGHRAAIIRQFRTVLWRAAVMHVLRRGALLTDAREHGRETAVDGHVPAFVNQGPSSAEVYPDTHPLLVRVVNARDHVLTDGLFEFRVEVRLVQLALAEAGIKGTPSDDTKRKRKATPEPDSVAPGTHAAAGTPGTCGYVFGQPAEGEGQRPDASPLATPTPTPPEPGSGRIDWRSGTDRISAAPPPRGKAGKRPTAAVEERSTKKRRGSTKLPDFLNRAHKPEFLSSPGAPSKRKSRTIDDDIIGLTSD